MKKLALLQTEKGVLVSRIWKLREKGQGVQQASSIELFEVFLEPRALTLDSSTSS